MKTNLKTLSAEVLNHVRGGEGDSTFQLPFDRKGYYNLPHTNDPIISEPTFDLPWDIQDDPGDGRGL